MKKRALKSAYEIAMAQAKRRLHPARLLHKGKIGTHQSTYCWHTKTPRADVCSICGCKIKANSPMESRPTGKNCKPQPWPYCQKCYDWAILGINIPEFVTDARERDRKSSVYYWDKFTSRNTSLPGDEYDDDEWLEYA